MSLGTSRARNASFDYSHKGERYRVEWEEDENILFLFFMKDGTELKQRKIKLLGTIDECQLESIVKDYWKHFVKTELKDIEI